ncbi:MAG: hypothetical protein AAGC68_07470 [Verrucomicrobiota bacterium]
MSSPSSDNSSKAHWIERLPGPPIVRGLFVVAALFLLIEIPLLISHARHGYFRIDGWFAFYAVLGFVSAALLVVIAMGLGNLLRRKEDPYVEQEEESLPEDLDEQLR